MSASRRPGASWQSHGPAGFAPRPRQRQHDKLELSIASLLDVLTIILFFLIKSYSSDPTQIAPAPGLRLPYAASQQAPEEATNLTITLTSITVDDQRVVALDHGRVPASDLQGGQLIQPLLDALVDTATHQKRVALVNRREAFRGLMTVIADRDVPFELLGQVLFTAGQAEFRRWKLAVIQSD